MADYISVGVLRRAVDWCIACGPSSSVGDPVEQDETTEVVKRILERLKTLLSETKTCVLRRLKNYEEPSETEAEPLMSSPPASLRKRGGASEGGSCASALDSLGQLVKILIEALQCVEDCYRRLIKERHGQLHRVEHLAAVQRLLEDLSERLTRGETALRKYHLIPVQGGDTAGQRPITYDPGDPPEASQQRLLEGVEEELKAAEQYLQIRDTAAQGDLSEASHCLLMLLLQIVRRAQDSVLTFYSLTEDQRQFSGASLRLLRELAEHLKEASLLTGYHVKTMQDPCSSHSLTVFPKSVRNGITKYLMLAAVLLFVIAGILVSIGGLNINQSTKQQIQTKCVQSSAVKDVKACEVLPPCGNDWIWYRNKCFYFSEGYGNWTEAADSCAALNSSLALIDTQEELNVMLRYKGDYNHWIGLRRYNKTYPWIWVSGTKFTNWFTVSDTSQCAYLSYDKVKSLECDILNKWICTKVTIFE